MLKKTVSNAAVEVASATGYSRTREYYDTR